MATPTMMHEVIETEDGQQVILEYPPGGRAAAIAQAEREHEALKKLHLKLSLLRPPPRMPATITANVQASDTVAQIKAQIASQLGVSAEGTRLLAS